LAGALRIKDRITGVLASGPLPAAAIASLLVLGTETVGVTLRRGEKEKLFVRVPCTVPIQWALRAHGEPT
jgi:hypothetical protein